MSVGVVHGVDHYEVGGKMRTLYAPDYLRSYVALCQQLWSTAREAHDRLNPEVPQLTYDIDLDD